MSRATKKNKAKVLHGTNIQHYHDESTWEGGNGHAQSQAVPCFGAWTHAAGAHGVLRSRVTAAGSPVQPPNPPTFSNFTRHLPSAPALPWTPRTTQPPPPREPPGVHAPICPPLVSASPPRTTKHRDLVGSSVSKAHRLPKQCLSSCHPLGHRQCLRG